MKKSILDITELRIKSLIASEARYNFPEFLKELRVALRRTKQSVCYDLDFEYDVLIRLELGKIRKFDAEKMARIAEYYDVPYSIMSEKCLLWIKSNKFKIKK